MNHFKNNNKKLEKLRGIFFQIGLIIAGGLTLLAFEWTSPVRIAELPGDPVINETTWEIPPIIQIEDEVQKPKVKHNTAPVITNQFKPVDDLKEEKKEDTKEEPKEPKEPFDPDKWKVVEPTEPEEPPVFIAGEMPHYKDCEALDEEKRTCSKHV